MPTVQKKLAGHLRYIGSMMVFIVGIMMSTCLYAEEEAFNRRRFENAFYVRDFEEIQKTVLAFPHSAKTYLSLGLTPLHLAWNGSIVNILTEAGANIEAQEPFDGDTPLHEAVQHGKTDVVDVLILNGANVDARNQKNNTPLHDAVRVGPSEIVEALLHNGADVNAQGLNHDTPLHTATAHTNYDAVMLLLDNGADVNTQNKDGETPLHNAALSSDSDTIKLLLNQGAEIDTKDKRGHTPLYNALRVRQYKIAKFLLDHNASVGSEERDLIMERALQEYEARGLPRNIAARRARLGAMLQKKGLYKDLYEAAIRFITEE